MRVRVSVRRTIKQGNETEAPDNNYFDPLRPSSILVFGARGMIGLPGASYTSNPIHGREIGQRYITWGAVLGVVPVTRICPGGVVNGCAPTAPNFGCIQPIKARLSVGRPKSCSWNFACPPRSIEGRGASISRLLAL